MIFMFYMMDKPDAFALRDELRPIHKAYLATKAADMAFAGPLKNDDDTKMVGTLLGIDFPNREAAAAWIKEEPFTKNGVYASMHIYPFENLWEQKKGFPPGK